MLFSVWPFSSSLPVTVRRAVAWGSALREFCVFSAKRSSAAPAGGHVYLADSEMARGSDCFCFLLRRAGTAASVSGCTGITSRARRA
jgi:hypothetical protein